VGTLLARNDPASAADVRHDIASDLREYVSAQSLDDVLLVASELVSNAVRHGCGGRPAPDRPAVDVGWEVSGEDVVLRVDDPSPTLPAPLRPDPHRPHGRGLAIVAAVASDWGACPTGAGKQVWARVPAHRP